VYASYVDEPVMMVSGAGTKHYFHQNHLYSVAAMTSSTGAVVERYRYDAYGKRTVTNAGGTPIAASTIGQQRGFTGYYLDGETELLHARARQYSPKLGRFIQRDPLGYVDGASLYGAYLVPNLVDPTGTKTKCTPKLVSGGYEQHNIYWGKTWRLYLYSWADGSPTDSRLSLSASASAGAYYLLFFTTDSVKIKAGFDVKCVCDEPTDKCTIAVTEKPGSEWDKTTGIATAALSGSVSASGDTATITARAGAANGSSGTVGAGVDIPGLGKAGGNITFPSSKLSATVTVGVWQWKCEKSQ